MICVLYNSDGVFAVCLQRGGTVMRYIRVGVIGTVKTDNFKKGDQRVPIVGLIYGWIGAGSARLSENKLQASLQASLVTYEPPYSSRSKGTPSKQNVIEAFVLGKEKKKGMSILIQQKLFESCSIIQGARTGEQHRQ